MSANSLVYHNPENEPHPDRRIVSVIDADGINVIFDPPIPCVMRDPDGKRRHVRLGDTDALVALVFAGWQMVEVA